MSPAGLHLTTSVLLLPSFSLFKTNVLTKTKLPKNVIVLLGTGVNMCSLYTLHLLLYCFYSRVVVIFEQSQEFLSGSLKFYHILSYHIFDQGSSMYSNKAAVSTGIPN